VKSSLLPHEELERAKSMILEENVPCVFFRDGKMEKTGEGTGVQPLISAWEQEPELLRGSVIVDKIVGKAAAMLAVLGGAAGVYGLTMSRTAQEYLAAHGVDFACEKTVERIINRMGTGLCPMEQTVLTMDDPEAGYRALKETMRRLRAGK